MHGAHWAPAKVTYLHDVKCVSGNHQRFTCHYTCDNAADALVLHIAQLLMIHVIILYGKILKFIHSMMPRHEDSSGRHSVAYLSDQVIQCVDPDHG